MMQFFSDRKIMVRNYFEKEGHWRKTKIKYVPYLHKYLLTHKKKTNKFQCYKWIKEKFSNWNRFFLNENVNFEKRRYFILVLKLKHQFLMSVQDAIWNIVRFSINLYNQCAFNVNLFKMFPIMKLDKCYLFLV